ANWTTRQPVGHRTGLLCSKPFECRPGALSPKLWHTVSVATTRLDQPDPGRGGRGNPCRAVSSLVRYPKHALLIGMKSHTLLDQTTFAVTVTEWQKQAGRHNLPWQNTRDPYRIWLSEIMLQQ